MFSPTGLSHMYTMSRSPVKSCATNVTLDHLMLVGVHNNTWDILFGILSTSNECWAKQDPFHIYTMLGILGDSFTNCATKDWIIGSSDHNYT